MQCSQLMRVAETKRKQCQLRQSVDEAYHIRILYIIDLHIKRLTELVSCYHAWASYASPFLLLSKIHLDMLIATVLLTNSPLPVHPFLPRSTTVYIRAQRPVSSAYRRVIDLWKSRSSMPPTSDTYTSDQISRPEPRAPYSTPDISDSSLELSSDEPLDPAATPPAADPVIVVVPDGTDESVVTLAAPKAASC